MNKRLRLRLLLPGAILTYIILLIVMVQTLHKVPLGCVQDHVQVKKCENTMSTEANKIIHVNEPVKRTLGLRSSHISKNPLFYRGHGPGEGGYQVNSSRINTTTRGEIDGRHGFNTLISDMISIHRKLKDNRPVPCQYIEYPTDLPPLSVVILFRDEWPSAVLRTAYSVLESSAPGILKEIVLVDDCSMNPELIELVNFHVDNVKKFRLIRNNASLGLMKGRDIGIKATTTDYFVVMDGHMEVGPGWLEPLLYRLVQEPRSLLTPNVGTLDLQTFETAFPHTNDQFMYFDILSMTNGWADYKTDFLASRLNDIDPTPYAIYPGMMTVMRKDFYLELGGFDTGMEIWGSEEIELSVKVWLCGGRVEMVPCSLAVHMYRSTPWKDSRYEGARARNKARVVAVWIDPPFRNFTFDTMRNSSHVTGDISERLRIRRTNKCKSFKSYVNTIRSFSRLYIPELPKKAGVMFNAFYGWCLDLEPGTYRLSLHPCRGNISQYFILTEHSEIRAIHGRVLRLNVYGSSRKVELVRSPVVVKDDRALWRYGDDSTVINAGTGLCLTAMSVDEVGVTTCTNDILQIWFWKKLTDF